MMASGLLPDTAAPLTAPFWSALNEGRLSAQRCTTCGYLRWPPSELCPECMRPGAAWETLRGTGTVWSYAVYRRAMHPALADAVPYTVAVIDLPEGIRVLGTVLTSTGDADADGEVRIGDAVSAVFEEVAPDQAMVRWIPAAQGPRGIA